MKEIKAWAVIAIDKKYKIPITKSRVWTEDGYEMDVFSIFRTRDLARRALNRVKLIYMEDFVKKMRVKKIKIIV